KDAAAQVDAGGLGGGRREQGLAQRQQSRIEVQRPLLGKGPRRGKFAFEGIGVELDVRQAVGWDKTLEGEELLAQVRPHCRLVVACLVKEEGFARQPDRAVGLLQAYAWQLNPAA